MSSKRDHGDGGIDQRGPDQWRLRWRLDAKRHSKAFHGTKRAAQAELRRLLAEVDAGTAVDPSRMTVAAYLRDWLDKERDLAPKTRERYGQLADWQIIPHLGSALLQKLRPAQIHEWHNALLATGRLSAQTIADAHKVLRTGLERAVRLELLARNVARTVRPPRRERREVASLADYDIGTVLKALEGHRLYPIVVLALGTGMRRGELAALAWGAVDLDAGLVRVERSLEQTEAGLRFKEPKTRHGIRTISLPASVVEMLREHRRQQVELRVALGLGRLGDDDLVFTRIDGSPYQPAAISRDWANFVRRHNLPRIMFHALRHSHASALISAVLDVVAVSKRLGHGSAAITLGVYAHKFTSTDAAAAAAIERALRGR
jgi:integrase